MTTVGYGDMAPETLGKHVSFIDLFTCKEGVSDRESKSGKV